nr:DUF4139 domain-containing protein [Streptomyces sp. Li-HN-5-13]
MAGQRAVWESGLESVVVHAVGAVCRRRAAGVLPADGRVRVSGLPLLAAAGSLRVRVLSGEGRVAEARLGYPARVRDEDELPSWEQELKNLRARFELLEERCRRLDERIAEVAALRPVPPQRRRDEGHRRAPADAVLALAEFVDARLEVLQERAVELAQQARLAEHAYQVAAARADARSTAERAGGVEAGACAELTVRGAGPVELEVEYTVPGAVWVPTYQLAHRRGERTARLVLRASVAQRTGEDWSGVRLALSTAGLLRAGALPELASLRIGRRRGGARAVGVARATGGPGRAVRRLAGRAAVETGAAGAAGGGVRGDGRGDGRRRPGAPAAAVAAAGRTAGRRARVRTWRRAGVRAGRAADAAGPDGDAGRGGRSPAAPDR